MIGAAIIGAAFGTLLSSFELLVRTETGLWLRISFRRFASEARHVDEAAERGSCANTPYAVALGESVHGRSRG